MSFNISTLNNISLLPSPSEFSSLRSPTDSDSIFHLYKKVAEVCRGYNASIQVINQLSRDLKKLSERQTLDLNLFPFKIYTLPSSLRPGNDQQQYTGSLNWRTVRVRSGLVLTNVVSTASFVHGTDLQQNYAYDNFLIQTIGVYDIQVPANTTQYWFWIEQSGSNFSGITSGTSPYYLRYASDPTSGS